MVVKKKTRVEQKKEKNKQTELESGEESLQYTKTNQASTSKCSLSNRMLTLDSIMSSISACEKTSHRSFYLS